MYLRARYYDPEIGGFISVDPAKDGGNWYAYCAGNPVNAWDPTGMWAETAADVISAIDSLSNLIENPSWVDAAFLVWDLTSVAIPGVPGSYGLKTLKGIAKIAGDASIKEMKLLHKQALKGLSWADKKALKATQRLEMDQLKNKIKAQKLAEKAALKFARAADRQITRLNLILNKAKYIRTTGGNTKMYETAGNYRTAEKHFKALKIQGAKRISTPFGSGQTGLLANGRRVTIRPGSKAGPPTLEILRPNQKGELGKVVEIRYGK